MIAAAEALVAGPVQIAIVGDGADLESAAWRLRPPGAVIAIGDPGQSDMPLLVGRPLVAGVPAAYVCRGMVCDLPVTTVDGLRAALRS